MEMTKQIKPTYIDGRCGHPASDHDDINGVCWGRILTVLDTEANCACTTYISDADLAVADAAYKECSRCGDDPYYCVCTTGWDPARGMIW
jgi:hypothetical protein